MDPELCARARDEYWRSMPPDWPLKRDDPASWVGPVEKEYELKEDRENARPDGGHNPDLRGFRWQAHKCGSDPFMIHMLATNAEMWEMAEQLLGVDCVAPCDGIRGVYGTLPYGPDAMRTGIGPEDGPPQPPGGPSEKTGALGRGVPWTRPGPNTPQGDRESCHNDAHGMHIGVVGLIDRVPPGGGSTMMWPGIHKRVFHLMNQQCNNGRLGHDGKQLHGQQGMNEDSPYADEMRRCNDDTTPVDVHGEAGDVVFWHHRVGHSASKNRSNVIRQAVLYDFRHKNLSLEERLQEGDVPDPTTAPPAYMWRDWSDEVKATPRKWSVELAREQRLIGGLVGGVEVTEENCVLPLEEWSPAHAERAAACTAYEEFPVEQQSKL